MTTRSSSSADRAGAVRFKVYIPARYASTRLPGKPLLEIRGRTLLNHVYDRALASGAEAVVVATDDERIAEHARACGATVCMTAASLPSGTDRIAAAAAQLREADDCIIVNLQGDEPQMPAAVIRQVAASVAAGEGDMATVCEPLEAAQILDPNVVKVVRDESGRALYFSRAGIPFRRDSSAADDDAEVLSAYRRHVGIYGYRVAFLQRFVAMPVARIERFEALEQLRALANGARIVVPDALAPCGHGIDTPADLERAQRG